MKMTMLGALLAGGFSLTALAAEPALTTQAQKLGYGAGLQMGQSLERSGMEADVEAVILGIRDAMGSKAPRLSETEMREAFAAGQAQAEKKRAEQAEARQREGERFLTENAKKPGVKTTESGLQYKVIKAGSDKKPADGAIVVTHYTGKLVDGEVFDSSRERGEPATFQVGQVIEGWNEALKMMGEGAQWELYIPAKLAYGARGAGGRIGPNEMLIFDVELIEVK